jgi:tetratricopeptide (TPR) repeat protein
VEFLEQLKAAIASSSAASHFVSNPCSSSSTGSTATSEHEHSLIVVDPVEEEEQRIWDELQSARQQRLETKRQAAELEAKVAAEMELGDGDADDESHTGNAEFGGFPFHVRKNHYKRKIKRLEDSFAILESERKDIDANRVRLTIFLKEKQIYVMSLANEKSRLKNFQAPVISSSLLHGTPMNYSLDDFKRDLDITYNKTMALMTKAKSDIINGEKRKAEIKASQNELSNELKERKAAFNLFMKKHDAVMKTMNSIRNLHGSHGQTIHHFFQRFVGFLNYRRKLKSKVATILTNLLKQTLRNAFKKWLTGEHVKIDISKDVCISMGGIMLLHAKELREDVQKQLRDAIAEVASIKKKLDVEMLPRKQHDAITKSAYFNRMEEGMDPGNLDTHGMHYLFEADGMAAQNKFDLAGELYETQIIYLRSMPQVNVKFLSITYGHKGKMYLRSERFDRAIIEFDRQLSLAKEISDTTELAEAYFGLGNAYLGRADYVNAIRYLDMGHAQFGILGHLPKQCEAKRALKRCYEKLNRPDLVVSISEQIDLIENEVAIKIKTMSEKLSNLSDRLTNTNADIEHIIELERVNERVINIRNSVKNQEALFAEKEEEIEKHKEKMRKIEEVIIEIDKEYQTAVKCDEKDMMSLYFNEIQPQVVEIEQLKVGLEANRKKKIEDLAFAEKEDGRLKTELNNIRDTISELNQEYEGNHILFIVFLIFFH